MKGLSEIIFASVNFLLFLYLLRRYASGWIREKLRQRKETIVRTLAEAQKTLAEAETLRHMYEKKVQEVEEEKRRFQEGLRQMAENEKRHILEEAHNLAERIRADARQVAQRELEEAYHLIQCEVANLAVEFATSLLRDRITAVDHHHFLQAFLREIRKE